MKVFRSTTFAQLVKTATEAFIGLWTCKKRIAKRAQVKSGTANQYRHSTASLNVFNYGGCLTSPVTGGVVDVWGDKIYQVMGYAATFGEWNFRSSDLDALINLDGVAIYYLAI